MLTDSTTMLSAERGHVILVDGSRSITLEHALPTEHLLDDDKSPPNLIVFPEERSIDVEMDACRDHPCERNGRGIYAIVQRIPLIKNSRLGRCVKKRLPIVRKHEKQIGLKDSATRLAMWPRLNCI